MVGEAQNRRAGTVWASVAEAENVISKPIVMRAAAMPIRIVASTRPRSASAGASADVLSLRASMEGPITHPGSSPNASAHMKHSVEEFGVKSFGVAS
jgi:hypothetical protein